MECSKCESAMLVLYYLSHPGKIVLVDLRVFYLQITVILAYGMPVTIF